MRWEKKNTQRKMKAWKQILIIYMKQNIISKYHLITFFIFLFMETHWWAKSSEVPQVRILPSPIWEQKAHGLSVRGVYFKHESASLQRTKRQVTLTPRNRRGFIYGLHPLRLISMKLSVGLTPLIKLTQKQFLYTSHASCLWIQLDHVFASLNLISDFVV